MYYMSLVQRYRKQTSFLLSEGAFYIVKPLLCFKLCENRKRNTTFPEKSIQIIA